MTLDIVISVEEKVHDAMDNLEGVSKQMSNTGKVQEREGKKAEKTLLMQKLGWLGLAGTAGATLLGITRKSAIAGLYLRDFSDALGYLLDEILSPMIPHLDSFSQKIWELGEWFSKLPDPIKKVTGGTFLLGSGLAVVAGGFLLLKKLGIIKLLTWIGAKFGITSGSVLAFGSSIKTALLSTVAGGVGIGLAIGLIVVKIMDMFGAFDMIGEWAEDFAAKNPILKLLLDSILLPVASVGVAILDLVRGDWAKIPEDVGFIWKKVEDQWESILSPLFDKMKVGFSNLGDDIVSTLSNWGEDISEYFSELSSRFDEWGMNLTESLLRGMSDLPRRLSNFLRDSIHDQVSWLPDWASGALGMSPTRIQIGEMSPESIENGIDRSAIEFHPKVSPGITPSMSGNTGNNKTISIEINSPINMNNASISSEYDIRKIGKELSEVWKDEIRRFI